MQYQIPQFDVQQIFTSFVNENVLLFFHGTFHEDGMTDLKELYQVLNFAMIAYCKCFFKVFHVNDNDYSRFHVSIIDSIL